MEFLKSALEFVINSIHNLIEWAKGLFTTAKEVAETAGEVVAETADEIIGDGTVLTDIADAAETVAEVVTETVGDVTGMFKGGLDTVTIA